MKIWSDADSLRLVLGRVAIVLAMVLSSAEGARAEYPVLVDGKIAPGTGFGVGVDDGKKLRTWLSEGDDHLKIEYPGGLSWAALFITVGGPAVPPPRPSLDFSQYKRLAVEMKGGVGGECVQVGIKDFDDRDDGTEPKKELILDKEWKTYELALSAFGKRHPSRSPLDLRKLYVVTELVLPCGPHQNSAQSIYVRNIRFIE